MHWRIQRGLATFVVTTMAATAALALDPPKSVRCVLHSTYGCESREGPCIFNLVRTPFQVTFSFAKGRYQSSWGGGRITQVWDAPDGTHKVVISYRLLAPN